MLRQSIFLLAAGTLAAGALMSLERAARADFFIHQWENHHAGEDRGVLGLDFTYFYTSANFDSTRNTFTPTGFTNYSAYHADLSGMYGLSEQFTLFGRLNWHGENANADPSLHTDAGTAYGFGDQSIAANFRIYQRRNSATAIDIQAQFDFPAYSNPVVATNHTPYLGDGSKDFTGGAFVTLPLAEHAKDDLLLIGGVGYTYRTNGFSSAIPWNLTFSYVPHDQGFKGSASFFGLQSLSTDKNASLVITNPLGSPGSGGSYITGATNPTLLTLGGTFGYQTSGHWDIMAAGALGIAGSTAPKGYQGSLGVAYRIGSKDEHPVKDPALMTPGQYGKSNRGEQNYGGMAKVMRANDRFNIIKIDKGSQDGVAKDDIYDIFIVKNDGSQGAAIARARVTNTRATDASLKVEEYYKEVWIEEGFIARKLFQ